MDRAYRKAVQIVFQHPDSSLNPRQTVGDILARPLRLYGGDVSTIPALLEEVRLPASYARRYPHQLSGGEKQRVAIARAFAARPDLVICDEITAPLDVSVQASVIELLLRLRERERHGLSVHHPRSQPGAAGRPSHRRHAAAAKSSIFSAWRCCARVRYILIRAS